MDTHLAMHLEFMRYYGLKEIPGKGQSNPIIDGWFDKIGFEWADDDLAWCSAMMNYLAWKLRLERSGKLDARSWLGVGINIPLEEAKIGHIVVFWRESIDSWKGHVGLYHGHDEVDIYVGGGNQDNQVNTTPYEIDGTNHGFMACRELRTLEEIEKSQNL